MSGQGAKFCTQIPAALCLILHRGNPLVNQHCVIWNLHLPLENRFLVLMTECNISLDLQRLGVVWSLSFALFVAKPRRQK